MGITPAIHGRSKRMAVVCYWIFLLIIIYDNLQVNFFVEIPRLHQINPQNGCTSVHYNARTTCQRVHCHSIAEFNRQFTQLVINGSWLNRIINQTTFQWNGSLIFYQNSARRLVFFVPKTVINGLKYFQSLSLALI